SLLRLPAGLLAALDGIHPFPLSRSRMTDPGRERHVQIGERWIGPGEWWRAGAPMHVLRLPVRARPLARARRTFPLRGTQTMSEPFLASGDRLGPYRVESALGAGGMGEVYRAVDTRLGRAVAVKVLSGPRAADPDRLRRFEQEARVVAALSHA